jgi:hypothetical protein
MVKRSGDKTAEPPGGRVAERLRMYMESRDSVPPQSVKTNKAPTTDQRPKGRREGSNAKQRRPKG